MDGKILVVNIGKFVIWDVKFYRSIHDCEIKGVVKLLDTIYKVEATKGGENEVRSCLMSCGTRYKAFSWQGKVHSKVGFLYKQHVEA